MGTVKRKIKGHDDHLHNHRALISFDKNGIPVVEKKVEVNKSNKDDIEFHFHDAEYIDDYMSAVSEYKKTFPSKEDVLNQTPDPAVVELIKHQNNLGIKTAFDRFDSQKPLCSFGLAGVCCKNCNMGPCKITAKSPKGICGADADLIVARNLLRSGAAGTAQHGVHAREVILNLKWAAEGKLDVPILGKEKLKIIASAFGIKTKNRKINNIAIDLANILLEDLSRAEADEFKTITAIAPEERQKVWKDLDILPISAYHEVFESYHNTACGVDGDYKSILKQFLRSGLAFTFNGVVGSNIATDCLFGVGDRVTSKVNVGALKKGYVNIAVHGHLPLLVQEIVKVGRSKKYQDLAKEAGAKGIEFYGICCSGLSALYRDYGVIPLSNAITAELVMVTGALDLWVADVQDVFPSIMEVAKCTQTKVVTTSASARLPGAEHIGFDHNHSNISDTRKIAEKIVEKAIESHVERAGLPVFIPPYEVEAEVGFSAEYIQKRFGGFERLYEALRSGEILGIVNLVGCNNPKVIYEKAIIDVADELLNNNILLFTNGCASFPLMKMGYCAKGSSKKAGDSLQAFLGEDLPAIWHMGECIDNTRASATFAAIAKEANEPIYKLPFAFSSPEWGNEKGINAALGFRLMGVSSYHCVEAQIYGSAKVTEFLKEGTRDILGSVMVVDADPKALAQKIVQDIKDKRKKLAWN